MARTMAPWKGDRYDRGGINGRKLLILGESSYKPGGHSDGYVISDRNRHLVCDAIGYDEGKGYWNNSNFFTRIVRMFGFDAHSYQHRLEFWNSVAYCNFLQLILTRPRQVPPCEAGQQAVEPFRDTLEELRPDYVLSFSMRMWKYHLPKDDDAEVGNAEGIFARKAKIRLSDGSEVKMLGFKHPTSRGFQWQTVASVLHRELA